MKATTIIVRVLIGLLLVYSSGRFFLYMAPEPVSTGEFKAIDIGLIATPYLLPLAKAIEFLCGLAFISGKFITLANIIALPVTFNILLINYYITPENLPLAIALFFGNLFLIYRYWDNYKPVFTP